MPEQPKPGDPAAPAPRKSALLPVAIAVVASLGAGAGAAWFLLQPNAVTATAEAAHGAEPAHSAEPAHGAEAAQGAEGAPAATGSASFAQRLLPLEPFIVNVNGDGYTRYLKVAMSLEASTLRAKQELDERSPQIRDLVIAILTSKRLEEIGNFEGKALLKEDVQRRVNELLPAGEVRSVLFTEFVVQ
jgi:flagellar FliL protein